MSPPVKEAERLQQQLDEMERDEFALRRKLILKDRRLDVLAQVLGYDVFPFHWLLINSKSMLPGPWRLFLAPRGAGKSTILTVVDCVMLALQDPNIRILIASRVKDQAKDILAEIQGCFESEAFQELFGDLRGDVWGKGEASVRRTKKWKEPTFMAAGADGPVTSKHFDVIKFDDLVDEKNSRTEGEREKIKTFVYKTCVPTLVKRRKDGTAGEIDFIGTRYHPEDIFSHLQEKEPRLKGNVCVIPALIDADTGEPDSKNGVSIVPEILPTSELHADRVSMGSAHFDSQYQQDTQRMKGEIFHDDYFRHYREDPKELVSRLGLKVWAACDLATAEDELDDEYADCVVGVDDSGGPGNFDVYVLENFHGRISYTAQLDRLDGIFERWDPIRFGIESNAFQKTRIRSVYRERGNNYGDRCYPLYTDKDKVTRAWKLAARYEAGRIWHRAGGLDDDLEGQLTGFPKKKLKDLFDAMDFAVYLGCVVRLRRKRKKKLGVPGARPRTRNAARTRRFGGIAA